MIKGDFLGLVASGQAATFKLANAEGSGPCIRKGGVRRVLSSVPSQADFSRKIAKFKTIMGLWDFLSSGLVPSSLPNTPANPRLTLRF